MKTRVEEALEICRSLLKSDANQKNDKPNPLYILEPLDTQNLFKGILFAPFSHFQEMSFQFFCAYSFLLDLNLTEEESQTSDYPPKIIFDKQIPHPFIDTNGMYCFPNIGRSHKITIHTPIGDVLKALGESFFFLSPYSSSSTQSCINPDALIIHDKSNPDKKSKMTIPYFLKRLSKFGDLSIYNPENNYKSDEETKK